MRIRHKKLLLSGTAVATAGILGVGALLGTSISVQASAEMFPGIETIVKNSTKSEPFRILELVDSSEDAEIGYYVSGQEPSIKLYEYQYQDTDGNTQTVHFSTLEEGLGMLPEKQRKEFAMNVKLDENGNVDENASTGIRKVSDIANTDGNVETSPLSKTADYQEKYFLSKGETEDDWKKLELKNFDGTARTDSVQLSGEYVEAESGDYTKGEQEYYPLRKDSQTDQGRAEKYRENIQNFYFSEGDDVRGSYYLQFAEVENETVNNALKDENDKGEKTILPEYEYANGKYGYFENVYTDLTTEIVENIKNKIFTFPGEQPEDVSGSANAVLIQDNTTSTSGADSSGDFNDGTVDTGESTATEAFGSGSDETVVSDAGESTRSGISEEEDFGSGEAGDETSGISDTESQEDELEIQDTEEGQSEDFSGEDSQSGDFEDDSARQSDSDETKASVILGEVTDGATAGSQSNPYVYLGESIEKYPFYKYTLIGDLAYLKAKVEASTEADAQKTAAGEAIVRAEGDITLADDQYWYWKSDKDGTLAKMPVSIVTGRQPVSYSDIREIPENLGYNYYYRVEKAWFCCEISNGGSEADPSAYTNFGWYYPSYPSGEDAYLRVNDGDGKTATHYISDAEYTLTPGKGSYNFVPGDGSTYLVQVDHIYYQGGYTNNDWLKRYVFHLSPNDEEFSNLNIQVDTRKASDFSEIYAAAGDTSTLELDNGEASVADAGQSEESFTDEAADLSAGEADEAEVSDGNAEASDTDDADAETLSDGGEEEEFEDGSATQAAEADTGILGDYDLIYINGELSKTTAAYFASSKVPCIVNTSKMTDNSVLKDTFYAYEKDSDADGHYVNTYVYFFKNTLQTGKEGSLINTAFHTDFNTGGEDGCEETKGFEEILSYIKSENKYRALGSSVDDSDDTVTDGSDNDLTDGTTLDPLSYEISQARAVEYIINYQYKRSQNSKSEIKVLEIEPYKYNSGETNKLSESNILQWIGEEQKSLIESVSACCYNSEGPSDRSIDGNSSTYWHSAYWGNTNEFDSSIKDTRGHIDSTAEGHHWLEIKLKEAETVSGLYYQPRPGGGNGVLKTYKIELYDANGKSLGTETGDTGYTSGSIGSSKKELSFNKEYSGVKKIRLTFQTTLGDTANKFASCAEIGVVTRKVTITTMTAAEFVGHKEDIAAEYDMIYLGGYDSARDDLINGTSRLLYAHVGGAVSVEEKLESGQTYITKLLGWLDNEWSTKGKTFAPVSTYSESGAGYLRGSGNDMTEQQCKELIGFVKSGYPVVLADNLVTGSGSDRSVDTTHVDGASWYYQFVKEALKYDNTVTWTEAAREKKLNSFYVDLAKPKIQFAENGKPPQPKRLNEEAQEGQGFIENNELKYVFTIENDSDAAPAVSTYNCKLYLDLNFDGNLSENESQDSYITITDSSGKALSQVSYGESDQRYELKLGEQYTVTRKIPAEYYKLITWKLVISNNTNSNIYTSETGYSKQKNTGTAQEIKALQITPDTVYNGATWNLDEKGNFQTALKAVEAEGDFTFQIDRKTVSDYEKWGEDAYSELKKYQILIIGFSDVYQNIPNDKGQVDAIKQYIRSGRSVIFSHDTTSYLCYNYNDVDKTIKADAAGTTTYSVFEDGWLNEKNPSWGISLNSILRSVVGMDRYGITADETLSGGQTISSLIKKGQELNSEDTIQSIVKYTGDAAYKSGNTKKDTTYAQTQGFTYGVLENTSIGDQKTSKATKVNTGAITEYPYKIADTMNIASTHGQYYQLALEQDWDNNGRSDGETDIVVWYCLSDSIYAKSPNDARNNYFYYSRGNVIYTGTGHSSAEKSTDEIQLFINSIVAAANVAQASPDVNFVKTLSPTAETETAHYYMTDQSKWVQDDDNTLEPDMELYINVKDYNMVSADLSQEDKDKQEMTLQFYIEDEKNGSVLTGEDILKEPSLANKKVTDITGAVGTLMDYGGGTLTVSADGKFHTKDNNAYALTIPAIEQYLRQTRADGTQDYRESCKVYVKVSSTVYLYGQAKTSTVWSSVDLKQRQLFDLD